ncbi:sigma-70 family RNA polymerase sigma factor [Flagellatimonas centrodinii]|uniref:RNA polymerase sigma factor n=1 Tax=Flagellatimonas centrodinii TaxID=2806210 RepID=UPI001FEFF4FF|nr:sigma-70 family RNA polymerase sigma factor [Flagellatimonas centrodinii]ULQ48006.1 sigma-70 family RNA polymerase sigma factor [Flagellatimonas centrodinii]
MNEPAPDVAENPVSLADFGSDDAARWENVARQYSKALNRFFANRVNNPADAEDMVQKVFVRVMQRSRNEPIEHVQRYLFQVAASVLNDELRRARSHHENAHDSFDEVEHPLRNDITPEREVMGEQSISRMIAALQELPPRTREVYVLRAMRRHKFNDIATQLRISNRAAQGHMARALAHIAKAINDDE